MTDSSNGEAVLEAATQEWADAFNRGDAAAIAALHSSDAQIMPPNGGIIECDSQSDKTIFRILMPASKDAKPATEENTP